MRRHLKSVTTFIFRTAILVLVFFLFQIPGSTASAQDNVNLVPASDSAFAKEHKQKKAESFNPGDMIMEHVVDNHEWHILEIGHFELTVPLPVILYYDGKLYTFCSSRFHNEEHAYQGFSLPEAGPDKGKIVRTSAIPAGPKVYDFSITKTVLAIMISALLMLLIFISIARAYANNRNKAPKGIQSMLEPLIIFIRDDIAKSSIGEKKYEKYMPYLLTIFFFIFLNNILGLIPIFPGGANVTGNIAVTMVMAVFTFILTTVSGNKHYWVDIINTPGVPWWLKLPLPLMPIVEIIGLITKPFVLMVRLFANITAGHIIALGFISLIFIFGAMNAALGYGVSVVSVAFMIFMNLLELLVAFIQAYVFTLLSALYFGLATIEPEHH
ncbi:MAG: F0F1 ATP synthase subunit A [Bacteroidetes bacterium]|nr:F0F1 ATP synthase subunit A [Bacteroidota bacterium]